MFCSRTLFAFPAIGLCELFVLEESTSPRTETTPPLLPSSPTPLQQALDEYRTDPAVAIAANRSDI